jgi:hypothetical protein
VNADDLTVFANNFSKGVGNPLATATVQAVPEPTTMMLVFSAGTAIVASICVQRRRKRRIEI